MLSEKKWDIKSLRDFWISDGFSNIKPESFGEFPEGFDPRKVLATVHQWVGEVEITELGCGYGRLCQSFSKSNYQGFDINPDAIARARKLFSGYHFDVIEYPEDLPGGGALLAYTVFLHMPDEVLVPWLRAAQERYRYIVVCELLGRDWRDTAGTTPVFNRDLSDYVELLSPFSLKAELRLPYKRYINTEFSAKVASTDISFLVFGRDGDPLDGLAFSKS